MRWTGFLAVLALTSCSPKGQPVLDLTLSSKVVTNATPVHVKVVATSGDGRVGVGSVKISSAHGSLSVPVDVTLDGFGTAKAELVCDPNTEASCGGQVLVSATWSSDGVAVTAEARLNSGIGAGTGAGTGGGGGSVMTAGCTASDPCLASAYKFEDQPECGSFCYYDEPHNLAVSGQETNSTGFSQFGPGQLLDGVRGNADWMVNQGHEWVGWLLVDGHVVFRFTKKRDFSAVRVGLNNHGTGAAAQPSEVRLEFGDDGSTFGPARSFRLTDGSLMAVPIGERADVRLPVTGAAGQYVRCTLVHAAGSWSLLDEVTFE